ncbi:RNA recognition family related [Cyclospora cayetanensis]|uniref:RNA recognition family related n=1 Tax=Cyclospora cayetanensis TaxID=88456 RepID=A0A1D3CSD9_9EIME|nr:RNA recognition family related [Cyclospora cayetanensis]
MEDDEYDLYEDLEGPASPSASSSGSNRPVPSVVTPAPAGAGAAAQPPAVGDEADDEDGVVVVGERPLFLGIPPPVPPLVDAKASQLLIVSNLPWWINDVSLRELSGAFGRVIGVRVLGSATGAKPSGVALLLFGAEQQAVAAAQGLDTAVSAYGNLTGSGRRLRIGVCPPHIWGPLEVLKPHWARGALLPKDLTATPLDDQRSQQQEAQHGEAAQQKTGLSALRSKAKRAKTEGAVVPPDRWQQQQQWWIQHNLLHQHHMQPGTVQQQHIQQQQRVVIPRGANAVPLGSKQPFVSLHQNPHF